MTNKISSFIILIILFLMIASTSSYAQSSCSSLIKTLSIDEAVTKDIDDGNISKKIYESKNDSCNSDGQTQNITVACSKGMKLCNGICTDTNTEANCGGCANSPNRGDHVCKMGRKCCNGVCCLPGDICCHGKCTDTYYDPDNCGGCGNTSSKLHTCQKGEICCGGVCVDTLLDNNNCGDCGNACSSGENCKGGECLPLDESGKDIDNAEEAYEDESE